MLGNFRGVSPENETALPQGLGVAFLPQQLPPPRPLPGLGAGLGRCDPQAQGSSQVSRGAIEKPALQCEPESALGVAA